jgi:hypothetical protein
MKWLRGPQHAHVPAQRQSIINRISHLYALIGYFKRTRSLTSAIICSKKVGHYKRENYLHSLLIHFSSPLRHTLTACTGGGFQSTASGLGVPSAA